VAELTHHGPSHRSASVGKRHAALESGRLWHEADSLGLEHRSSYITLGADLYHFGPASIGATRSFGPARSIASSAVLARSRFARLRCSAIATHAERPS
jgi:hypothetical protein